MELNICQEIQTTIQRNPKQFGDKCCSSLSFQQHAALAAFLGPAGQLHLGSPVWDDQELQQGGSPTLHQGDEQDVHPGYLQLEEHPGDVREPTEDQLGGEIPYSKLLSMVPPPKFLLWRCLSLFSGTTQGLLWTRPCCTERTRGASMDFVSECLLLRLGDITIHQVPHSDHAGRQQTVDPRPLRWQSSADPGSHQGYIQQCFLMNFEFRFLSCQVFYFIEPITLRLYEDSRVG